MTLLQSRLFTGAILVWALVAGASPAGALRAAENQAPKEADLIQILQSAAPPADKALACKRLAIYGSKAAVPALAALLPDRELSSWARIGLEAIPDQAAVDALREVMDKVEGRLLIGVINSLGRRRDAKAVNALVARLAAADTGVASAAAEALGRIGGDQAAKALQASLATAPAAARPAVAEGCVMCAEQLVATGKREAAVNLYEAVRRAEVPKHKVLEATRGVILARGAGGLPLLLEHLRSNDKALFGIGLRTARELPGADVTKALAEEVDLAQAERRPLLLAILGDRGDATVLPVVSRALVQGEKPSRLAAIQALDRLHQPSATPALVGALTDPDADVAQTAKAVLVRLSGNEVDADLAARLAQASGKQRQALTEVASLRRIEAALPTMAAGADDPDPGVRRASLAALGILGEPKQAGDLLRLLQQGGRATERADLEKALLAICARRGASCLPHASALAQSKDPDLRKVALSALSSIGGAAALAAVTAAVDDKDEGVQDEAVRTLSTWTSNWPDDPAVAEPLLKLARSAKKPSHQVLGLRGYLQYIQSDTKLPEAEKVAKVTDLLPLLRRPEDMRLAIPVIGSIPTGKSLELLMSCAEDSAVAEEAYLALASLAGRPSLEDASKELRQKALRTVLEKSKEARTKKRAEEALKKIE